MTSLSTFIKEKQWNQVVVLLLLLLLLGMGGVPGYLTGNWQWKQPPNVTSLKELRQIYQTGLTLPGWQTIQQGVQQIGGHKWSLQVIKQEGSETQAILLFLPQTTSKDQPEVEWSEIKGWGKSRWQKWEIAQHRSAEFTVKQPMEAKVEASFFRASTEQDTFAVLQWYAWPNGGDSSPLRWFLTDQLAQWRQQRTAWVAVSILLPMEPLGQVEKTWPLVKSLGETVQARLMVAALRTSN
ncbi:MAG: cyanoexosortase B system-associated protein [Gloeotrichia echinulata GP01]